MPSKNRFGMADAFRHPVVNTQSHSTASILSPFSSSRRKKIPSSPPQGQGLGKRWKKRGAENRFHKRYFLWIEVQILSGQDAWNGMVDRLCNPPPVRDTVLRNAGAYRI
jgi:hypothetical protein